MRLINDGAVGSDYGAVQVSDGTQITAVTLISPDSETGVLAVTGRDGSTVMAELPSGISNNFAGAVAFDVSGLEIGGSTSTTINLPTGLQVDSSNSAYMRFNYLTNQFTDYVDNQGNPLYSFQDTNGDGTPDAVVLQLVDGDPQWDGDGEANGTVVDPGFVGNGQRTFMGTKRRDTLIGNVLSNTMDGYAGRDWLQGDAGRDVLKGGRDKDRLWGGAGADQITGGKHADRILYYSANESTIDQADTVKFGKKDRFQFRSFDGDSVTEGQQSLRYIGKKAFSGSAGELRFTGGGLQADTTGDGQADFVVNFAKATPWFSEANILI
ncbi:calcium-binding protein [Synechococcus sp. HK05]|uniref:calcium-binding protein n=1 Tax=Synechococcus sp. HK05 TaxID=2725975 RepID=UPI0020CAAF99|nr:choice-of-anchor U domain-containing protein [Synechococcus sp. HK05]